MTAIHKAVVDTGPLFSILVLNYSRTLHTDAGEAVIERNRIPLYLRSKNQQTSMIDLFDGMQTILTSSHVIAEMQGLQKLKGPHYGEFWLFAMKWLSSKRLDEQLIKLAE